MNRCVIIISVLLNFLHVFGQVGIGTVSPDPSSLVDMSSTDQGILIPRVSLTDVTDTQLDGVNTAVQGLMIFNTNASVTGGSGIGFYYFNGTEWVSVLTSELGDIWKASGNIGTDGGINDFMGTTDNVGLTFRTNDVNRWQLSTAGEWVPLNSNSSVFIGSNSGSSSTGLGNISIGTNAGTAIGTGQLNVIIGHEAGLTASNLSNNTFVGSYTGYSITSGANNTFIGSGAGGSTTTGSSNTFVGLSTAQRNNTGERNVMMGRTAGLFNYQGSYNVYIGMDAGEGTLVAGENTADSNNVYLGYQSGKNASGGSNVFLGNQAGFSASGSNLLYIENTNSNTPLIYGEFDNDLVVVNGDLTVMGTFSNPSDISLKEDIVPLDNSLSRVQEIGGYHYYWRYENPENRKLQTGVLAQEVQKVFPELVSESHTGMLQVNYLGLIPYLIESVKSQQTAVEKLQDQNSQLIKRIQLLERQQNSEN